MSVLLVYIRILSVLLYVNQPEKHTRNIVDFINCDTVTN